VVDLYRIRCSRWSGFYIWWAGSAYRRLGHTPSEKDEVWPYVCCRRLGVSANSEQM
jgi:hypothetical protein